jgi:hypothetical protein
LSQALAAVPDSKTSVGFTNWDAALAGQRTGEAQRRDLLTRSVLRELSSDLGAPLGLRLADIAWEAYSEWSSGKVLLLRLNRGADFSPGRLRKAGYTPTSQIWVAGKASPAYGSIVASVRWLPGRRLVVASARPQTVLAVLDVLAGRRPALAANVAARAAAEPLTKSASVLLKPGALGCLDTRADTTDEATRQVRAAEDRFGDLAKYRYLGRGLSDIPGDRANQRFVVAMPFSSSRMASTQAAVRAALSDGPFIGRIGPMDDVLRLKSTRTDGSTVVLTYDHPADSEVLMTGRGPLLPAAC